MTSRPNLRTTATLALLAAAGCGARSQLIAPDVGTDAVDVIDATLAPEAGIQPAIDTRCPGTCPLGGVPAVFPPATPLARPDVPAICATGFELGGPSGGCGRATYTIHTTRSAGARAITLNVDFATYLVPDAVTVTALDGAGMRYTLLETCRLQTSILGGPSDRRPGDDTIRQFRLAVRDGTRQLDFDFGAVTSPMYLRVLGLCDFAVTPYADAVWWQSVP